MEEIKLTAIEWINASKQMPKSREDLEVIARIIGFDMNGSDYVEYKVLTYRPSLNCFLSWEYNNEGRMIAKHYNNENNVKKVGQPIVTHWSCFNRVGGDF